MPLFHFADFLSLPSVLRLNLLSLTRKAIALGLTLASIGSSSPLSATEVALTFHSPRWTISTSSSGESADLFEKALRAAKEQSEKANAPEGARDKAWQLSERSSSQQSLLASAEYKTDTSLGSSKLPGIQSISPDNVVMGQVISIAGSHFGTPKGTVGLAGVSSPIISWSDTSISFRVPAAVKTGADAVVITTAVGVLATGTLHVLFAPVISTLSPIVGIPYTQVTITGTGFGAGTPGTVTFNTVAGQIQSWSDTKIIVKTPDGAAGGGPVAVNWRGASSNGVAFNYVPSIFYLSNPTISREQRSFSIVGQNFLTEVGTVTLNGKRLETHSWSNKSISVAAEEDSCSGPVVVNTRYGVSNPIVLTIAGSGDGEEKCQSPHHTPGANAGPNQTVFVHATVQLDGSGSTDSNGHPLTYRWSFISVPSGSTATLSDAKSVKPTFVADKSGSYTVQLVVNDGFCDSSPSRVVVTTKNSPPIANAGPNQTVKTRALVHLDGGGSTDVDGDTLSYHWLLQSEPASSNAVLSSSTLVNPTFTADQKGSYLAQLIVNDGKLDSAPSVVTVNTVNSSPVANPGANQKINVGATIQLDGSRSTDVDGDALSYSWAILSKPTGSNATLSNARIVNPTLVGDAIGDYVVQLIVNDGTTDSQPATVTISTENVAPVANAGPSQTVALGAHVALDGTASTDAGNRPLTYQWSLLSAPSGSIAAVSPPNSSNPFFTADRSGSYVAQLIVNDGYLNSLPATVTISTINSLPVADPGPPQTVTVGATVNLSGAASSDADGDPLTYKWAITSQPAGGSAALSNATSLSPAFVASLEGIYVIQLIVNDGHADSAPKTQTITATTPNQAPVVNAGPDQTITLPATLVVLNGSVQDDGKPTGAAVTVSWSGPAGVSFSDSTAVNSQATFAAAGVYVLHLSASDTQLSSSSDVTITVKPPTNLPPVVSAGANASVPYPNTYTLQGSVSDDGKPAGHLTSTWSQISGPTGAPPVLFADLHSPTSTVTLKIAGSYVLRLTGDDTQLQTTADVTITAIRGNQPPHVNAGSDQTIPLSANSAILNGSATDDGLPQGNSLVYSWSKIAGPAGALVVFSSPTTLTSSATFSDPGVYVLRLSASDSELTGSATVSITVQPHNSAPVVSSGTAQTIFLPNGATVQGTVTDDGFPLGGKLTTAWSVTSGPGIVTFSNGAARATTATFSAIGNYVLRLTASDSDLSSLSEVTISVRAANQPPAVNAGPNQTIILTSNASNLPTVPTLIAITKGFLNGVGIDYHQPTNDLVMSVNYPDGAGHNFELVGADGTRSQFSNVSGLTDEVYIATARDEGSGISQGGFLAGEMLTGSGVSGVVVRISPDGTKIQNPWVTLPGEDGLLRGQLYLDRTGVFGGDLIVATTSGNLWRVNSAGVPTFLANIGVSAEGLLTLPNESRYGPWAGTIIAGSETQPRIFTIDAKGNVNSYDMGISAEHIKLINANENYYGVDFTSQTLWGLPAAELSSMVGDILIAEETPGNLWQVRWNGSQFETTRIAQVPQFEGGTMSPAGNAEVSSTNATVALNGTATDDGQPVGGALSSLWSLVSGPGTVTFSSPASLVTSATFSQPGTYVLRLTGNDSELSSSSDLTIKIQANQAPVVDPGPEPQIIFPASADLKGTVTDDGLPNGTLYSFWTKVFGPGRVNFSTPTYDAGADFSSTSNPNGTWAYGWTPTRGGTFTVDPVNLQIPLANWFRGPNQAVPLVGYNDSGAPYQAGTAMFPAGGINMHPGIIGENAVVRWTVPNTGTFLVQGRFFAADVGGTSTDVAVLLNSSTTVLSGNVNGPAIAPGRGAGVPFSFVKTLNAGDVLDFTVGFGTNGTYYNDSTGLSVAITPAAAPSTTASFGLPGDYELRLAGFDGEKFSFNDLHVKVLPTCTPALAGLIGWWPGEGDTQDLVGGNNGLVEGSGLGFAQGKVAQSFNFTGGDGDVVVPSSPSYNNPSFTLDTWIYPTDLSTLRPILEFNGGGVNGNNGPFGAHLWINFNASSVISPGAIYANIVDSNGGYHIFGTVGGAVPLRQWSHVALTYDNSTGQARIYVNASPVAVANLGSFTPQTSFPFYFGVRPGSTYHFLGQLDEVGIFNRALSTGEINSIFAAGSMGKCGSTVLPLLVSAGPNQTITLPIRQVALHGVATDSSGTQSSVAWSQVGGPGAVTFTNPAAAITTASFSASGIYILRLTASQGSQRSASDVTITVNGGLNRPPQIAVGGSYTLPWPVKILSLNATITDDGFPQGSTVTQQWSQTSGPGTVTFSDPNQAATQVTFPATGTFVLQLSASDTQDISNASITVTVLTDPGVAPQVIIATVPQVQIPTSAGLSATVTAPGLPSGAVLTQLWTVTSGPGAVTFAHPGLLNTSASFSLPGTYILRLTASDTLLTGFGEITVTVAASATPPPRVSLSLPDNLEITKPLAVTGSVSGGTYVLQYALQTGDPDKLTYTTFASGTGPVNNGTLGTFDPTMLVNGLYVLQLVATDPSGQFSTVTASGTVRGNLKVGNFSLSFQDVTVSMPGLPITVTRTYDSRDRSVGDFGAGWTLSVGNVRVQKNGPTGRGWDEQVTWSGMFDQYCLQSTKDHFVTITFPGNQIYKFQAGASPECQSLGPIDAPTIIFTQMPTGSATSGATLVPLDGGAVLTDGSIPGPQSLIDYNSNIYNPTQFQLTTGEGFTYTLDQTLGVTQVTDPNGNILTINTNGIIHSSGKSVAFTRDAQNRITQISDPNGKFVKYHYDAAGNLATVVDHVDNTTTFGYDNNHYLISILDPRGVQAVRNTYDADGRLAATTDAAGNTINFAHDVADNHELITDRLGNTTLFEYDADGNITRTTDPLGHVTSAIYDANDNKLTETNALGKTTSFTYDALGNQTSITDPLNHTSTSTYNALRQPLTITDQLGHLTINTYDGQGNLLTTQDPLGNVTTYVNNAQGLPLTVTDALSNKTGFVYDGNGNATQQTDALGNVSNFTYDGNGSKLTQTVTRTRADGVKESLTTQYRYDGNNRLVKTINPDGSSTQTVYNSIGQQSDIIDALGRKTHNDYAANGHRSNTTYADGNTESETYDANDRRVTSTDRAGHTSIFTYDAAGQLIKTTDADQSSTQTVYDAAGRSIKTIDALGHVTQYGYDDAGRRTSITDPLNRVTSFAYDAAGNQISITDALNHTNQFVYDAANRRVQTVYPDTTTDASSYDALGRPTSTTDQAGRVTKFGYDALGRLTSVMRFLNGQPLVTTYAYNEVGERVTQTDANGHATSFAYDQLGRRISRSLPLGMHESYRYDAVGNLLSKTDFSGHTTTYQFNSLNRLTGKTADAFFSTGACGAAPGCGPQQIGFTYTAVGQRNSMTDASGVTTFAYDNRNRLLTKATPFGNLSYTYDAAGNMLSLQSSNTGGASMTYAYDALDRPASVTDVSGVTNYSYDAAGNLAGYAYPNGVSTTYNYNTLNRLTNMQSICATGNGCGAPQTALATYAYTLGPTGNRLSVAELSGRTVQYGYDDLYRLTSETVADAATQNGSISYTYDAAGNRTQRSSTLPALPATGLLNYDANDRTATDPYDANGNLLLGGPGANVYDFENRLVQAGSIQIVYDGDGNRVQETAAGVTTSYLVADQNLTGYAHVVEELRNGAMNRAYSYGLELINQRQAISGASTTSFYGFDGHGSVRFLTSSTGAVTDTYDYDAFGNLIASTGNSPNSYLFAGESYDQALGTYYNRARYLNVNSGRFLSQDPSEGNDEKPATQHRYFYAGDDPVNNIDPSGEDFSIGEVSAGLDMMNTLDAMPQLNFNTILKVVPREETLYIRAFAPWKTFGAGFSGDNRSFTTSRTKGVTSRINGIVKFLFPSLAILSQYAYSDPSQRGSNIATDHPEITATGGKGKMHVEEAGSNPLVSFSADIDVKLDMSAQEKSGQACYEGHAYGDAFPNTEIFVVNKKDEATMLHTFATSGGRETGAYLYLPGDNNRNMGSFSQCAPK